MSNCSKGREKGYQAANSSIPQELRNESWLDNSSQTAGGHITLYSWSLIACGEGLESICLFAFDGNDYLISGDYNSNYWEFIDFDHIDSKAIIRKFKI